MIAAIHVACRVDAFAAILATVLEAALATVLETALETALAALE
jgi:hypothetical protein